MSLSVWANQFGIDEKKAVLENENEITDDTINELSKQAPFIEGFIPEEFEVEAYDDDLKWYMWYTVDGIGILVNESDKSDEEIHELYEQQIY